MNRILKTAVASLLLGSTTLAGAQSPAESFADRYRQFQAVSSQGPAYRPAPTFSNTPAGQRPRVSIAQYQALSSDAPAWQRNDTNTTTYALAPGVTNQAAAATPGKPATSVARDGSETSARAN
jgi:hypothetical protein